MKNLQTAGRVVVTLALVVCALFVGRELWNHYMNDPWTRDARVRADVVAVAPDVSGLVSEVLVKDNDVVRKGDILFKVDERRFEIAVTQAEAAVEGAKATLEQASRDRKRREQLGGVISEQQKEAAQSAEATAQASYLQATASLELARLNRERSQIKAPVNGTITNLSLRPGNYVTTGSSQMALVDTDSIRVEGYFEETKLARIRVGDFVKVKLMGQSEAITGHVDSIAAGIEDRERTAGSGLLANINPTFSWVRLAQRIPVRIALDQIPQKTQLVAGMTATVTVAPDAAVSVARLPGAGDIEQN
ncbi:efflux RND transporter periplasmic adaptor subunit [Phyllobacterium sp. SYP-B3895]|uniref:efflux RND transporter periplasmic adaptor subunit n=1 Tax=Phyllobacterium sp. SYP-B3895 TaxID=2663240 RepID=UPI001299CFAA|nr:HlyD family secretion protein [Phyllobacterium sp. SYP-B3895]MRG57560.1 efflux RND transporter periplasmic adaptor subunit [Phyllobacterium sp. SYP-B3895]